MAFVEPRLKSFFFRRLPTDAEDLSQETLLGIFRSLPRFDVESRELPLISSFWRWTFTIARHRLSDAFKKRYGHLIRIALSIGDLDSADPYLTDYDLIICTAEKLDSLIRHHAPWLGLISTIIVDEVHLLNDPGRGPTLEILITILKQLLKNAQIIALSATIGNAKELAEWLEAELVVDDWRPVKLHKGVYLNGEVEFE